jgi:hypothetical protein
MTYGEIPRLRVIDPPQKHGVVITKRIGLRCTGECRCGAKLGTGIREEISQTFYRHIQTVKH